MNFKLQRPYIYFSLTANALIFGHSLLSGDVHNDFIFIVNYS